MEVVYVVQILPFIRIKMEVGRRIPVPRTLAPQIAEQRIVAQRIQAVRTLERQIRGRQTAEQRIQERQILEQPILAAPKLVQPIQEQPIQEQLIILHLLYHLDEEERDEVFLFQRRIYVQMEICQQVSMMESVS